MNFQLNLLTDIHHNLITICYAGYIVSHGLPNRDMPIVTTLNKKQKPPDLDIPPRADQSL